MGWAPLTAAWVHTGARFALAISDGKYDAPQWLWSILIVEIILFSCFGINQMWSLVSRDALGKEERRKRFVRTEWVYVILSFANITNENVFHKSK